MGSSERVRSIDIGLLDRSKAMNKAISALKLYTKGRDGDVVGTPPSRSGLPESTQKPDTPAHGGNGVLVPTHSRRTSRWRSSFQSQKKKKKGRAKGRQPIDEPRSVARDDVVLGELQGRRHDDGQRLPLDR
jgi:hypothetical protein